MTQSRLHSFVEANANTFIGFVGSMLIWEFVINPSWGFKTSLLSNLTITSIFTLWSIVRGYYVRRYFNWRSKHAKSS